MGSMRTWSLAAVAGIFIVVVAHQRSSADAGNAVSGPVVAAAVATSPAPASARVTGLPDFSGLVAETGPAVVNISVTEKAQRLMTGGGEGTVHSSVVASHGFMGAFLPRFMLQKRLMKKRICAAAVK